MATKIAVPAVIASPLTLGCVTDVVAPSRYIWRRNGGMLGVPSQNNLTINLTPKDYGATFSVTVFGENGSEFAEAKLPAAPVPVAKPTPVPAQVVGQKPAIAPPAPPVVK